MKGGYSPDAVRARAGVPLRIAFDRQEDGDCSARVVFPELAVSHWLAPHETTVVELTFDRPGTFGFACGMNMIHGTLLVEGDAPAEVPAAQVASANAAGSAVARDKGGEPLWILRPGRPRVVQAADEVQTPTSGLSALPFTCSGAAKASSFGVLNAWTKPARDSSASRAATM